MASTRRVYGGRKEEGGGQRTPHIKVRPAEDKPVREKEVREAGAELGQNHESAATEKTFKFGFP